VTKRWERELRRLDDVDVPTERIRAHAADRPADPSHGDGLPPRRQRITAGVVAVVVFVAAGAFAWQAFRPSGEKGDVVQPGPGTTVEIALVAYHEDGPSSPSATLNVADVSVHGVLTSYSWSEGNSTLNADTVAPSFNPSDYTPVALPADLEVTGDASSADLAVQTPGEFPFTTIEDLGAVTKAVPIDQGPGRYVLQVMAHWPQGDVPFYFPIELVDQAQASPTPASLSFVGMDPPEGTLAFGSTHQSGKKSGYNWCDESDACKRVFIDFASYPPVSRFMEIPVGTPLIVEGSVASLRGGFHTLLGEKATPTFKYPADLGQVPTEPGQYVLQLHVALDGQDGEHGDGTFWFGVQAVGSASSTPDPQVTLASTSWRIVTIDDSPLPDQMADASLVFSDTTVSGWTGCNRFETGFEVADMHLVTRGGSVTQVACDLSEADLLEVIFDDPSIQTDGSSLVLTGPGGKTVELFAADTAPVDELRVSCQPNTTQVLDTRVVAGPSGVKVSLPDAGHADNVRFEALEGQEMSGLKVPLQPRPSRFPISLEPGSWTVGCIAPELGQESTVRIQVLDPSGLWASPGVECEVAHRVDLALQPAASTLKNAVRQALVLPPGDEVRSPTYPRAATTLSLPAHLVVVRDGGTIAALDVTTGGIAGDVCDFANLEPAP